MISSNNLKSILHHHLQLLTAIDNKFDQHIQNDSLSHKLTKMLAILQFTGKIKEIRRLCNKSSEIQSLKFEQKCEQFVILREIRTKNIQNLGPSDVQDLNKLLELVENAIFNDLLNPKIESEGCTIKNKELSNMLYSKAQTYLLESLKTFDSLSKLANMICSFERLLDFITQEYKFMINHIDQINGTIKNLIENSSLNFPITNKDYDKIDLLQIDGILNKIAIEIEPLIDVFNFFEHNGMIFEFSHIISGYIKLECYYFNKICIAISGGNGHWNSKWDDLEFCILKILKRCSVVQHSQFMLRIVDRICLFYENHFRINNEPLKSSCSKLDYLSIASKALILLEKIIITLEDLINFADCADPLHRLKILSEHLQEDIIGRIEADYNIFINEASESEREIFLGILFLMKNKQSINNLNV